MSGDRGGGERSASPQAARDRGDRGPEPAQGDSPGRRDRSDVTGDGRRGTDGGGNGRGRRDGSADDRGQADPGPPGDRADRSRDGGERADRGAGDDRASPEAGDRPDVTAIREPGEALDRIADPLEARDLDGRTSEELAELGAALEERLEADARELDRLDEAARGLREELDEARAALDAGGQSPLEGDRQTTEEQGWFAAHLDMSHDLHELDGDQLAGLRDALEQRLTGEVVELRGLEVAAEPLQEQVDELAEQAAAVQERVAETQARLSDVADADARWQAEPGGQSLEGSGLQTSEEQGWFAAHLDMSHDLHELDGAQLTALRDALEDRLAGDQAELHTLEEAATPLREELDALEEQAAAMEQHVSATRGRVEDVRAAQEASVREHAEALREVEAARAAVEIGSAERGDHLDAVRAAEWRAWSRELQQLGDRRAALEQRLEDLSPERSLGHRKVDETRGLIDGLSDHASEAAGRLGAEAREQIEGTVTELRGALEELEDVRAAQQERWGKQAQAIRTLTERRLSAHVEVVPFEGEPYEGLFAFEVGRHNPELAGVWDAALDHVFAADEVQAARNLRMGYSARSGEGDGSIGNEIPGGLASLGTGLAKGVRGAIGGVAGAVVREMAANTAGSVLSNSVEAVVTGAPGAVRELGASGRRRRALEGAAEERRRSAAP